MGVLLGLGDAQLSSAGCRDHLAQGLSQVAGREQRGDQRLQGGRVLHHAQRAGEGDQAPAVETVEQRIQQCREDLADPVGTEVGHQEAVAIAHPVVAGDRGRRNELVAQLLGIGGLDRRARALRAFAPARGEQVVGRGHALPALVAVHRIEAAGDRGDRSGGLRLEGLEKPERALRRRVASVEKGMHQHLQAGGAQGLRQSRDVVLHRMDAARREQSHEVHPSAAGLHRLHEIKKRRHCGQFLTLDGLVDAHQFLLHHTARTDVHVSDLGVPELAAGQANLELGGLQQGMRPLGERLVEEGRMRLEHGIVRPLLAMAEAIEDAENDGAGGFGLGRHLSAAFLASGGGRGRLYTRFRLLLQARPGGTLSRDGRDGRRGSTGRGRAAPPAARAPGGAARSWRRARAAGRPPAAAPGPGRRHRR